MANLNKYRTHEALNTTVGGNWDVGTAATTGSSADVANSIHYNLAAGTHTMGVHSGVEIYFSFSADSGSDVSDTNDLLLPKNTLTFLTVPRGLGNNIYFNHNSTTTDTGSVRIVEI
jgi:hypothetical protein